MFLLSSVLVATVPLETAPAQWPWQGRRAWPRRRPARGAPSSPAPSAPAGAGVSAAGIAEGQLRPNGLLGASIFGSGDRDTRPVLLLLGGARRFSPLVFSVIEICPFVTWA